MNSSYGQLQVSVFAETLGTPINHAKVQVRDKQTNSILEELRTDSSGQIPSFLLSAPPIEYSMSYGTPKPYSEYNIFVTADSFEPAFIDGIQILPSNKALENVFMKYQKTTAPQTNTILINEHTLVGDYPAKIPEEEIKILPESTGFIVLPKPVIPEFIVVHLGMPQNKEAKDVWIPFKDYIKNVASCEIYSTWPEETMKANILAIISFTLNRVYTEWYRGKGYSFTITNNTAFDHAFNYGRNIFEKISIIVDDIFSTYITKPNIKQPLFTQYCDGRRVQCKKGMHQWGSKDLGEMGYSATNILKNYYGYDIYFETAQKVEGVPKSYGGTDLAIGSSGNDVRMIQEQLNEISNHYPKIPKIRVDGIYGKQTQTAVETFQEIFYLPVNGIVDFATWYEISNIYVAVKKLSELV